MEGKLGVHTNGRSEASSPPSLLVVERASDLRSILRASLRDHYQIAEVSSGDGAAQHLEHCPPQGLIVGRITARGDETLGAMLRGVEAPPVLKLWVKRPPAEWADRALRHPFLRSDLLRAVDRLLHRGEGRRRMSDVGRRLNGTKNAADTQR